MTGERDLGKLLRHMTPQLQPGTFVFCTFPGEDVPAGRASDFDLSRFGGTGPSIRVGPPDWRPTATS